MSSLYKRATPVQLRMLRIVEGAVLNTIDAHDLGDGFLFDTKRFARSVAKRAVGTLSAQIILADVLAETHLSVTNGGASLGKSPAR